ncbi:prolipoprotein diacylglyceryl transferase [Ekhidna sp. MALMAid0563]|uniref:prolipoprotein diacylglyceryl transferase n=1 Tax=Ekhidna sp. MALMAid0563 TaxID=3143937 RepID=UPI0032DF3336
MHPELFSIGDFTIHTYGFLIMVGATMGFLYMSHVANRDLDIEKDKIQNLAIMVIIAAFVGGKLFFYLENPGYYFSSWSNMKQNFRTGFVFYGSLLFAVPLIVWYFRKEKWPLWPLMDRLAIAACIIHGLGRIGCFFAGCCHGVSTDVPWGVTFTDPVSQAEPLNTPLHPTQLYSAGLIFGILIILLMLKRHNRFEGQLFFIYIILYAVGRGIIEIFRGDEERGYIIDGVLSHSQFISIGVIAITVWAYLRFKKRARFKKK